MNGKSCNNPTTASGIHFVVMGPSGCGKSTIGAALAKSLHVPFVDGDALHPPANVAKMASGQPLTDADRWPWLTRVGARLNEGEVVIACSALARRYRRHILNTCTLTQFVELRVPRAELYHRMLDRKHFMPPALLDSQLSTWEHLRAYEPGISVVNDETVQRLVTRVREILAAHVES